MMREVDKSYMAAFIDGEGTITLRVRHKNNLPFFDPRVIAYNNAREVIEWIKKIVGHGTIKSNKKQYRWVLRPQDKIRKFLIDIFPYLKIHRKIKLATLMLEWLDLHQQTKTHQNPNIWIGERYIWSQREYDIQEEIKRLNKK